MSGTLSKNTWSLKLYKWKSTDKCGRRAWVEVWRVNTGQARGERRCGFIIQCNMDKYIRYSDSDYRLCFLSSLCQWSRRAGHILSVTCLNKLSGVWGHRGIGGGYIARSFSQSRQSLCDIPAQYAYMRCSFRNLTSTYRFSRHWWIRKITISLFLRPILM